jgi:hypothetical protein
LDSSSVLLKELQSEQHLDLPSVLRKELQLEKHLDSQSVLLKEQQLELHLDLPLSERCLVCWMPMVLVQA